MRKYFKHQVEKALQIKDLITIEYLEMSENFKYPSEIHDFYEIIYVEKGSLTGEIEGRKTLLFQNEFLMIEPNKEHSYFLTEKQSAKVLIICLSCKSNIINIINDKVTLSEREKNIVIDILSESRKCFKFPFEKKLVPLSNPRFGAQQIIENYIEQLLISVIRHITDNQTDIKFVKNKDDFDQSLTNDILTLLKENVYNDLNLDYVCKVNYYSKTYLNNIFKRVKSYSIMQYYNLLKINEAKRLLQKGKSITDISVLLCFDSPNYFTKVFKKFAGVTPSEYKNTK